jgi:predicted dinucleotide-utilizing enzyme
MSSRTTCQVGLVGYGAIGKSVADALLDGRAGNASLAAVLVRDVNKYWGCLPFSSSPPRITFTDDADTFFGCDFDLLDLGRVSEPTCFFSGTAREAAARFVKSSNITAMLALSTTGLDDTRVRLVADPARCSMHTLVEFDGAAGSLRVEWEGVPSESNPSTSADVPLSVIKAIRNLASPVCLGV